MSERDEEQIGAILGRLLTRAQKLSRRTGCLDEESLAVYLTGHLADSQKRDIEEHLGGCPHCLDELSVAHRAAQTGEIESVSQGVLQRAMALMPSNRAPAYFLDLAVQLIRDSLELISTSGELVFAAAPAAIRGKGKTPASGTVQVSKQLEKYTVTVEVERTNDLCQVAVIATPAADALADGLRFSLLSGEREQASYLARQGTAIFDRIPPGRYQLAVAEAGSTLGIIELTIQEDSRER